MVRLCSGSRDVMTPPPPPKRVPGVSLTLKWVSDLICSQSKQWSEAIPESNQLKTKMK